LLNVCAVKWHVLTSFDKNGKTIVTKDKRINSRHVRDVESAGIELISVPEDYLLGRVGDQALSIQIPAKSLLTPMMSSPEEVLGQPARCRC